MPHITAKKLTELEEMANTVREDIIRMLVEAKSGHSAGPLGMADIFTAFYFYILKHNPQKPDWPERDRLILSNGHIVPVRYAAMARAGYFPVDELMTLRKFGSRLQGHPERARLPGLETTSGPLGEGLPQAAGMAYASRMPREAGSASGGDVPNPFFYCLMSDAEQAAGITYEAILFAGKNRLSNLIGVIDRNNIQIDGVTEDIMPLEPLRAKYEACNWHVIEVAGNNIEQFIDAVEEAQAIENRPTCIIAHTIPGKGVDFMEYKYQWHGIPPNAEQAAKALLELRTLGGKIKSEHE